MKISKFLLLAVFAALFTAPILAQDNEKEEIPLAEAIPAGQPMPDDAPPDPNAPPKAAPDEEAKPADAEKEAAELAALAPPERNAAAYKPSAAERNWKKSATSLQLAENGRALVPIIISARAGRATHDKVRELANYLNRITGATFEVRYADDTVYDYNPKTGGKSSFASRKAAATALAQKYAANAQKPIEPVPTAGLVVGTDDEWIVPAELKEGLAMHGVYHGREAFAIRTNSKRILAIAGQERGMNHLTYRLLHEMGCRWFTPGAHWEIVPEDKNLTFGIDLTDRPSVGSRIIAFMDGSNGDEERAAQGAWGRRNRNGTSFSGGVGHMWHRIIQDNEATLAQHPEYFAMLGGKRYDPFVVGKDGKRQIRNVTSLWTKLEVANPAVRKMFVDHALAVFRNNPNAEMVGLSPNDGGGFSNSPESRKVGDGSISDNVYAMVNEVARAVKKEFPGKMVGCYAYRETAGPPSFPLEDNVYIEVATLFNMSKYNTAQLLQLWPQKAKHLGVYRYFSYFDAGGSEMSGGPVARINWTTNVIRGDYARNTSAIFAQSSNAFAMQMRGYLVATRLMWNPDEDVNAILADFYEKSYGPAAATMQKFHEALAPTDRDERLVGSYGMGVVYRLLDKATKEAKDRPDVLWRLADLKMYFRWQQLRGLGGASNKTEEGRVQIGENYMKLVAHLNAMAPTYMAQTNMIVKRMSKNLGPRLRGVTLPDRKNYDFEPSLERIEAEFQAALATLPEKELPRVKFDLTDLVPVEFPPLTGLQPAPRIAPVAAPPADPDAAAQKRDYYQGSTPMYAFYSWKGEPIEVEIRAGMRGSGKSGRIENWKLYKSDGSGEWKQIARGDVPADKSLQKLSIPVPGKGSYGFQFNAGSLAGTIYYPFTKPVTVVASGAKDYPRPWIYVPKGTKEIWMTYNVFGGGYVTLLQPDGKATQKMTNGVYTIPVPPGMDGQLWRMNGPFRGQEFYNIPNLAALTPQMLMVPRAVAIADSLKIRE